MPSPNAANCHAKPRCKWRMVWKDFAYKCLKRKGEPYVTIGTCSKCVRREDG